MQSSVRHNLSSSRAFLKMERCGGDRGKGFFWSVDEKFSQTLEEQEMKVKQAAAAAARGISSGSADVTGKVRKKEKGAPLEPALKRSVKGDTKGVLPPPLTSSPLPFKNALPPTPAPSSGAQTTQPAVPDGQAPGPTVNTSTMNSATTGVFAYPSLPQNPKQSSTLTSYSGTPITGLNPYAPLAQANWAMHSAVPNSQSHDSSTSNASRVPPAPVASASPQPPPGQTAVPDVVIPIVLGPIPPTHPDYAPNHPNNSTKEGYMILHERKLILDPDVFAELTKEMLAELEKMGAREALGVLTGHMIRALKERRAKGRGRDRGSRRSRGTGRGGAVRKTPVATTAPFTNVPLEHRRKPASADGTNGMEVKMVINGDGNVEMKPPTPVPSSIPEPVPIGVTPTRNVLPQAEPGSPIIVIDDVSEDEGPATKRRKMDNGWIP